MTTRMLATAVLVPWALARFTKQLWLRPFSLDGKVVLITGGGCGIGRGLAEKIWATAADVTLVLLDIDAAALADTKEQLEAVDAKGDSRVLTFRCDVSNESDVATCISHVKEAVAPGHIHVLVNNAGIVNGRDIADLTPAQLQRIFGVNVLAHFYLVQHVLPSMKASDRECLIVSIASMFSFMFGCKLADYCATKAAVYAFHSSLRLELLRDGLDNKIRTLIVCPLGIRTGMFDGIFDRDNGLFNLQERLGLMLTPAQVVTSIHTAILNGEQQVVSCHLGVVGSLMEWFTPLLRLLPIPAQDLVVKLGGMLRGMDTFVGRPNKAPAALTPVASSTEDSSADDEAEPEMEPMEADPRL